MILYHLALMNIENLENNEDFSYQQQVELKRIFRSNTGKNVLSFLMLSDCLYDYGEEDYVDINIRK